LLLNRSFFSLQRPWLPTAAALLLAVCLLCGLLLRPNKSKFVAQAGSR
jgi:hypothetical protein